MSACRLCTRPTGDSAVVCASCSLGLERDLGDVAAFAAELDTTLSRQTASGERHGGRSAEKPLPLDLAASEAGGQLRVVLVGWVLVLHRWLPYFGPECPTDKCGMHSSCHWAVMHAIPEPEPADTLPAMAAWLLCRVDPIRHHEAGDEIVREVESAMVKVRQAVDLAHYRARFFVGPCPEVDGEGTPCPGDIRALVPADPEKPAVMRCEACGVTWGAEQWNRAGQRILERKAREQERRAG